MKFKPKFCSIIFISVFGLSNSLLAQERNIVENLVPNGNFDMGRSKSRSVRPWRYTNTVDVYLQNVPPRYGRTTTWNLPSPHSGNKYVGLRLEKKYREFIQIKLSETLKAGTKYYFEMWVCPSEDVPYKVINIGASFYHNKIPYTFSDNLIRNPANIKFQDYQGIKGSAPNQWIKVSGVYRARGGERYLTIGDFSVSKRDKQLVANNWYNFLKFHFEAYYFIDSVKMYKIPDIQPEEKNIKETIANTETKEIPADSVDMDMSKENYIYKIEAQKTLTLKRVNFEFGSAKLLSSSYSDLELVLEYLHQNGDSKIKIMGFTDNVGDDDSNLKLSQKRAKAVYDYFIKNKVDKSRLTYIGYGESKPIATNETPKGRKQNRRVEIELVK